MEHVKEKKVSMEWSSGWYVYSLFGNTGLTVGLNDDGITNYCTWNSTEGDIKGTDVARAMLAMAEHPGFISTDDAGFLEGVKNGTIIAGVNGVWNAVAVEEAWGSGFGAAKLPSYTCAGQQVQMASFSGYKLIGVNAYSSHPQWAAKLAEWIASEENQALRFQLRGLPISKPPLLQKYKVPPPSPHCWNSLNFPASNASAAISGNLSPRLPPISWPEI